MLQRGGSKEGKDRNFLSIAQKRPSFGRTLIFEFAACGLTTSWILVAVRSNIRCSPRVRKRVGPYGASQRIRPTIKSDRRLGNERAELGKARIARSAPVDRPTGNSNRERWPEDWSEGVLGSRLSYRLREEEAGRRGPFERDRLPPPDLLPPLERFSPPDRPPPRLPPPPRDERGPPGRREPPPGRPRPTGGLDVLRP
jgi:hypothetical protein